MIHKRYRRILLFSARILAGFIYWDIFLPRIGLRRFSLRTRSRRIRATAQAFRMLAIQMGGVLIKIGQFLSTRVDVLPKEFTDELKGLQDEVPAEDFEDIRQVAEAELGGLLEEKYAFFESQPLAAASLGQVHRARLLQKDVLDRQDASQKVVLDVVVKIQRPNIESLIDTDLAALRTVSGWLMRYPPVRRRANLPSLMDEFARVLYEEVDYLAEGRNAEVFAENFKDDAGIRVPQVIWTHTTTRVLTLENVFAIKITDYDVITAAGINRSDVASRLLDIYFKQIFEDGFFHADPHPGNLFVYPLPRQTLDSPNGSGKTWQLTFVDFGMVGRLPPNTRAGMREMIIGVGTKDAARVVKSFQMLGLLLPGADLRQIEIAEAKVFDRFWGKNMTELTQLSPEELREVSREFRDLIYTMPFQIPQDFIFLARTIGILSGMCTGLDPLLNLWEHLAPYAGKLIAEEARNNREFWLEQVKVFVRTLLAYPARVEGVLGNFERGEIAVKTPDIARQASRIEAAIRQGVLSIVFSAFLLAGVLIYLLSTGYLWVFPLFAAVICILWIVALGRKKW
jgi:predicted unusual protein kinase regulating ubiquinone biosynthesis (AarF/ABC1/UbiB family)